MNRLKAQREFLSYAKRYDVGNPRIALKVIHTLHVAEICDNIARLQGLPTEDIGLAWLGGLLHDIGRFEQLRRWDTFSDSESAPHALIGVEALFGPGAAGLDEPLVDPAWTCPIKTFIQTRKHDALIRTAVEVHSAFRIPEGLDDRTRAISTIVRDADKVDIMRTLEENSAQTILKVSDEEFLSSRFSPEALAAFREHRCLRRDERHSPADYLLGLAAFVFELEYPASRQFLKDRGYLHAFLVRPFKLEPAFTDPFTREQYHLIAQEAMEWLER